jgi:toxin HigB-1
MAWIVRFKDAAKKALARVPAHIMVKLNLWVQLVEGRGLFEARKIPGFHDEPLKGKRLGQRSIRLSSSYRAIYTVESGGAVEILWVEEVSKHDY